MNSSLNSKSIAYAATTGLLAFGYISAGLFYLSGAPQIVDGFTHLGYPVTFVTLLGAWKLAGGIVVALPRLARVKEWAYAGMGINLTAALYAHAVSGDGVKEMVAPVVLLAVAVASWALRPASRRLSENSVVAAAPTTAREDIRLAA